MNHTQTDNFRLKHKWLQALILSASGLTWNLYAAETPAVPAADDGLTIKAKTETLTAKPTAPRPTTVPAWGSEASSEPELRKPGELLISGRQPQVIIAKPLQAADTSAAAPQTESQPAQNQNVPSAKPATDSVLPATHPWTLPIVRLPIMFPSNNITSAGGSGARIQVSGDGKIEMREIIAPLPVGPLHTGLNPVRLPYVYGQSNTPAATPPAKP